MHIKLSLYTMIAAALLATSPALAQSTGMKNGSANASTTKAVCSPGDPNVMVNTKNKTYMMDKAANKAAMSAKSGKSMQSTGSMKSDSMKGDSMDTSGSMSAMKSMCKSEADSMGAKMASSATK